MGHHIRYAICKILYRMISMEKPGVGRVTIWASRITGRLVHLNICPEDQGTPICVDNPTHAQANVLAVAPTAIMLRSYAAFITRPTRIP